LCCSCAGIDHNYTCGRCGIEWWLRRGRCEWCLLADTLDAVIDGPIDLSPLRARLLAVARPDRILIWLSRPHVRSLIRGLAAGTVPLSHDGLDRFERRGAADHLRGLLVVSGLLPRRDERLARFDRWVDEHLAQQAATPDDTRVLRRYATWGVRRQLVAASRGSELRDAQITNATQRLRVAAELLHWLRRRGRPLSGCTQSDLDEWFSTPPTTRAKARTFVRWAMRNGHCPKLRLPGYRPGTAPVVGHPERLDILRRLLDPTTASLEHRVAVMLLVLLGQPFTRIAAIRVDDVIAGRDQLGVRLGNGITPIPCPFADLVRDLLGRRPHLNTATNPTSPWLFPGRRAGTHLTPSALRFRAIALGVNLVGARTGALHQLLLECPPAVAADMLGYSYPTIDRHAQRAGSPWAAYASHRRHLSSPPL
jgi:hypothetical protein